MERDGKEYKEVLIVCPNCKREMRLAIAEEKMEKRKIEVVKLGEKEGCIFNDRVSIELSPSEIERLKVIFTFRALKAGTYVVQTAEREMHDIFDEAYGMWRKERNEKKGEVWL